MGKPSGESRAGWVLDEDPAAKRKRASKVLSSLKRAHGLPESFLDHRDPFELLVAVMLSAQSTDATVNKITPRLFEKYRGPEGFLAAAPGELEADIRSSGYFNQKARAIRGMCAALIEHHGGKVPASMDALLALPGVARKTANVVLSQAFGINVGIAVDTHVHRLAWRLGLSDHDDPVKVERDLQAVIPRSRWGEVTNLLIVHGRTTCPARSPKCGECVVSRSCPASRVAPGAPA